MSGANPANFSAGQQIANPIYIVDSSGNQISSFGGGTQYTTGNATPGSPIGTLPVFDNAGTIAKVSLAVGLPVNIVGGGGSGGTAVADDAAFTAGSTSFTPSGGVYNDAVAAATSGHADTVRLSQNRAFHINIRSNAGTELATASNPLQVSLANTAANGTAVSVSAASLPLPSGAATAAKQPALGAAGTASSDVITIQGIASMTKLLVTPDSVALPANQSTNVAQVAGTTTDTNSGTKSAGTLRVVLATDQPALTNKLLVTPDSVALPANQSVNNAQVAGTTVDTNSGTKSAGTQRVVLATDQPALTNPLLISRSTVAAYTLASVTTSGSTQNSGDITVGPYTEISLDINTTAQAGTSPTIQYFYERKAADGIYYVLWQSAVLTAAANTLSTSIGAGMAYNQSLGVTGRLRWVVGGTATPTFTHTANLQGK